MTAAHKCPIIPNPVCKHGRPAVEGQRVECREREDGVIMHIITGTMVLCSSCLLENWVGMMRFDNE